MRVAIIHDWLTGMRGGERCLEVLCEMYPGADVFTMIYSPQDITETIQRHKPRASIVQRFPFVRRYYRYLLPLYPWVSRNIGKRLAKAHAAEPYDLVISVSHCLAKNVPVPEGVPHVSYCLTPMRYIWDHYSSYFENSPLEPLISRVAARLRRWDVECSKKVTAYAGISEYIVDRIYRCYGRDAEVIYPPVSTEWIKPRRQAEDGREFLCVSALVPYKNVELIVSAFNKAGYKLTVVGRGPESVKLHKIARSNITFFDFISDEQLADLYRQCRAMVFAAEEDFGMTPVEAQAAGRPVIAYGRGGALETVNTLEGQQSGVLFPELTTASLISALEYFVDHEQEFSVDNCTKQASHFSVERFRQDLLKLVSSVLPESISLNEEKKLRKQANF